MVQRVDVLMYAAKRKGKGRVEHAVVADDQGWAGFERRAMARVLCNRAARVRPQGEDGEEFATVRDVSAGGVGIHLEKRFGRDTVLVVEPLLPGARTLLARVSRVTAGDGGWTHGCVLLARLSAEEVSDWTAASRPAPVAQAQG
jgi:hypothetical protein